MGNRFCCALAFVLVALGNHGFVAEGNLHAQQLDVEANDPASKSARLRHEFSDPATWKFEGVTSFSIQQMKSAITGSIDFLKASFPNSSDDDLASSIQAAVVRGYHNRGFANVRVSARIDRQRKALTVRVDEGAKFLAGDIQIVGAKQLSIERLVHWCQREQPVEQADIPLRVSDKNQVTQLRNREGRLDEPAADKLAAYKVEVKHDPVWQTGMSRSLLPESQEHLKKYLVQGFEDQGFYHAQYDFQVVADVQSQTLRLTVDIKNEGPRATIGELEVSGQAFNSREQILAHLQLAEGQPISGLRCAELERRLFESGRFLRHATLVVPGTAQQPKAKLFIDLREFNGAPTLAQEFSQPQNMAIEVANWVSSWSKSNQDLVIDLKISAALRDRLEELKAFPYVDQIPVGITRAIVSPKGGLIIQLLPDRQVYKNAEPFHLAFSPEGIIKIDGPETDVVTFTGNQDSSFIVTCQLVGVPKNPADTKVSLSLGLGFTPGKKGHVVSFAPATAIESLTHADKLSVHETPTELQLLTGNSEIVFDRTTGSVKQLRMLIGPAEIGAAELTITPQLGAYEAAQTELRRIVGQRNVMPRKAAPTEFLKMVGSVGTNWLNKNADAFKQNNQSWMLSLLDASIWQPVIDQFHDSAYAESFNIPHTSQISSQFGMHLLYQMLGLAMQSKETQSIGQIAGMLLPMATQGVSFESPVFAFGSPPWVINRHRTLQMVGGSQQQFMDALLTDNNQIGPLGCLYGAKLSANAAEQKRFAQVGLEMIDRFELDQAWLLERNSLTRTMMEVTANAFAHQSPEDVKRFLEALGQRPISDADVAGILEPLDADRKMTDKMLADFTTALWSFWFQALTEASLQATLWSNDTYLRNLLVRGDQRRAAGLPREAARDFNLALKAIDQIVDLNKGKPSDLWVARLRGDVHFAIAKCTPPGLSRTESLTAIASLQQAQLAYEAAMVGFQIGTPTREQLNALQQLSDISAAKGLHQLSLGDSPAAVASFDQSVTFFDRATGGVLVGDQKEVMASKLNALAWQLATSSNPAVRDAAKAVKLAVRSNELLEGRDAISLSTLAASHASNGDFKQAVHFAQQALAICPAAEKPAYEQRLRLFTNNQPYDQPPVRIALEAEGSRQ